MLYKLFNHKLYNMKKQSPGGRLFLAALFLMASLGLGLCGCGSGGHSADAEDLTTGSSSQKEGQKAETWQLNDFVMSTVLSATVYGSEDITPEIKARLDKLEKEELSWRQADSTVARINAAGKENKSASCGSDFAAWTRQSLDLAQKSGGAFDPSIGELTRLWDIEGENPKVPDPDKLEDVMGHIGFDKIHVDQAGENQSEGSGIELEEGATLDLGAVGKGIACDLIRDYFNKEEKETVSGAVVSVGGSILVYGSKPDGSDWKVAIQDPRGADGEYMGTVSLDHDAVVSTSGDYEKYFEEDGVRYHHILDPHTGYPSDSGLISVSVICENGLLSDGLSTACFVLGREKGLELLKEYGAEGVFIDQDKRLTLTEGLEGSFSIINSDYKK